MIIVLNLSCVYPNDNFNGIINNNIHKILTLSYKKNKHVNDGDIWKFNNFIT